MQNINCSIKYHPGQLQALPCDFKSTPSTICSHQEERRKKLKVGLGG